MRKRRFQPYTLENITITNAGSEGKSIARHDDKVIMVDYAVPGDIADLRIYGSKKSFSFAAIEQLKTPSPSRVDTFCSHFGICGGCKWQQMSYAAQLQFKQQQVQDAFERIGKFPFPAITPILGSTETIHYRNKLEYSFTHQKWLQNLDQKEAMDPSEHFGLGYHIPGRFDKVFDVERCWLMDDLQNRIRNRIREYCIQNELSFFNLYSQEGLMRGLIFRNTLKGEWMLLVIFGHAGEEEKRLGLMECLKSEFPEITSLQFIINTKRNDTISDLAVHLYAGSDHLTENLEDLQFRIGPTTFFQTNTHQTLHLYGKAREMAQLTGNENVYDLYTGVGTIALFVARQAKQVIGIEYVEESIRDARINAQLNNNHNTHFYAGDMKDVLTKELFQKHGAPDVIITDPPRAGMHGDVIQSILEANPSRIVYVSCNPATQARDIALMQDQYTVTQVQPVDMFPHTHHVENIALLERKIQS